MESRVYRESVRLRSTLRRSFASGLASIASADRRAAAAPSCEPATAIQSVLVPPAGTLTL